MLTLALYIETLIITTVNQRRAGFEVRVILHTHC